jgi:type IV pilus assembly protein PilZ
MKTLNTEHRVLKLLIPDISVLRACYMPFLQRKGLFVPSIQYRELGEKFFLVLRLAQHQQSAAGMVSVCWITPKYASDGREPGYGLHFDEGADELTAVIESVLGASAVNTQSVVSYTL